MSWTRFGKLIVASMALALSASAVEAGHGRCRTCSSGGNAPGTWYHFASAGGMYVPRVSTVSASSQPYGSGQVIVPSSYATGCRPSVRYVRPCAGCGR